MGTRLYAASSPLTRAQRVWWFSLALAALICCLGLCGISVPLAGAQGQARNASAHGCAPDVPPAVANTIPAQALPGSVLINEVLLQPKSNWNCSEPSTVFSQANDAWIELYNPQRQNLDLYAAHAQLSLNGGSSSMYFPFGASIAAGGFLVVFPLEKQTAPPPASWNILLSIGGVTIDQAVLPALQPDQSYARVPDGSTTWLYAGSPTIDASNNNIGQLQTPTSPPGATPTRGVTATVARSSTGAGSSNQPASSGTQPPWNQISFPLTPSPTLTNTETSAPATREENPPSDPPTPQSNGPNGWSIAFIAFLSLALLCTLVGGWRLTRTP